jgi:hypothetical protein
LRLRLPAHRVGRRGPGRARQRLNATL